MAHIGGLLEEHILWGVSVGWLGNLEQLAQREGKCLQAGELLVLEAVPCVDVLVPLAWAQVSRRPSPGAGAVPCMLFMQPDRTRISPAHARAAHLSQDCSPELSRR